MPANGLADGLQHLFRASKDVAVALALRQLLNARLADLGEVLDVSLDSGRRRVQLRIALRGEAEPVDVDLRRYHVERVDEQDSLTVLEAVASREWLTAALQLFVVGRAFRLPPKAAPVVRMLI